MAKKAAPKEVAKTQYHVQMRDGTKQRIRLPSHWKPTFGPLCPGSKDSNGPANVSLRFYDGTQQKAVFTGVESFRDMSIEIEVEVEKKQEETYFKKDNDGNEKAVIVEGRTREWVNPDKPGSNIGELHKSNMPRLLAASNTIDSDAKAETSAIKAWGGGSGSAGSGGNSLR